MEHKDRMRCAQELCSRLVEKYKEGIILCGVYGSTAQGLDVDRSDLEMLLVIRDDCEARGQHLLYRDIAVGYMVVARSRLEELLANPSLEGACGWPFYMGVLNVLKVLWGERSQVDAWLKIGEEVPYAAFREALEDHLPQLIVESYGRIFSCRERGNQDDWYCAVLEVLFEMRDALCLLNRSWVTHDYMQGMMDTLRFPLLPRRYEEVLLALWRARDIDQAIPLAQELVENFRQLLSEEGIKLRVYDAVSGIPV